MRHIGKIIAEMNGPIEYTPDHLTYERRGRELPNDLVAVCRDCHAIAHGAKTVY